MASSDETPPVKKAGFEMQFPGKRSGVKIQQVKMDYQGEAERGDEAALAPLTAITLPTKQQMILFRRMMYFISLLLVIVFLTAAASLALTVTILTSGKTLSPTSAAGM